MPKKANMPSTKRNQYDLRVFRQTLPVVSQYANLSGNQRSVTGSVHLTHSSSALRMGEIKENIPVVDGRREAPRPRDTSWLFGKKHVHSVEYKKGGRCVKCGDSKFRVPIGDQKIFGNGRFMASDSAVQ